MEDYKIVINYLKEKPETWNDIRNASFAYQFLPGEHEKAHQFFGQDREAKCLRCNRTREDVRWNWTSDNPECQNPLVVDIKSVVFKEEQLFEKLLVKAKIIAENLDYSKLSGEYLCTLHHTHGIDPSMLECALLDLNKQKISENIIDDYMKEYEKHRNTGKLGYKPTIIVAK